MPWYTSSRQAPARDCKSRAFLSLWSTSDDISGRGFPCSTHTLRLLWSFQKFENFCYHAKGIWTSCLLTDFDPYINKTSQKFLICDSAKLSLSVSFVNWWRTMDSAVKKKKNNENENTWKRELVSAVKTWNQWSIISNKAAEDSSVPDFDVKA